MQRQVLSSTKRTVAGASSCFVRERVPEIRTGGAHERSSGPDNE
jgi:hypothetical protein